MVSQLLLFAFSYSSYTVGAKGFFGFGYQTTPTGVDGSTYFYFCAHSIQKREGDGSRKSHPLRIVDCA